LPLQKPLPTEPQLASSPVLDHLRTFMAVAVHGSVARAAEVLFKAPSAVTRSLMELERGLGMAIFERKPRGMLLNAYGQAVMVRARRIQDEIGAACDEFARSEVSKTSGRNVLAGVLFSDRKVELLIALAEHRTLSAAAASCELTQAGASMALSRMESALECPLFQRMAQGLVPTDAAARIVIRAKRVVAEIRHLQSDIAALSGSVAGVVTIGTLPLGRTFVVPTGIAHALTLHPGLRVVTYENHYEQLMASLRSGEIDVIFGALRKADLSQGVVCEPLFRDRLGIVVRSGHPLVEAGVPDLRSLLGHKWILPRPNAPGRRVVDEFFNDSGLEPPKPSVETGDLAMLRQLLKSSDMLTAISPHQLMFEIAEGSLVELPIQVGTTEREIGFTLRQGSALSPGALAVLSAIRRQASVYGNLN
jgi:LysR family transcriptional regulator, regulator for genes of the gallate degradation pathway